MNETTKRVAEYITKYSSNKWVRIPKKGKRCKEAQPAKRYYIESRFVDYTNGRYLCPKCEKMNKFTINFVFIHLACGYCGCVVQMKPKKLETNLNKITLYNIHNVILDKQNNDIDRLRGKVFSMGDGYLYFNDDLNGYLFILSALDSKKYRYYAPCIMYANGDYIELIPTEKRPYTLKQARSILKEITEGE